MSFQTRINGKKFCLLVTVFFMLALQAQTCLAQKISEPFRKDIVKLLKITGSESLGLKMGMAISNQFIDNLSRQNPNIPPTAIAAIKSEISRVFVENMPKLSSELVQVYADHFTQEDIEGLISFYETPLGKKAVHEMPQIMQESFALGRNWGQQLLPELRTRLKARLEKEGFDEKSAQ